MISRTNRNSLTACGVTRLEPGKAYFVLRSMCPTALNGSQDFVDWVILLQLWLLDYSSVPGHAF
jgi:hypothetical protein